MTGRELANDLERLMRTRTLVHLCGEVLFCEAWPLEEDPTRGKRPPVIHVRVWCVACARGVEQHVTEAALQQVYGGAEQLIAHLMDEAARRIDAVIIPPCPVHAVPMDGAVTYDMMRREYVITLGCKKCGGRSASVPASERALIAAPRPCDALNAAMDLCMERWTKERGDLEEFEL